MQSLLFVTRGTVELILLLKESSQNRLSTLSTPSKIRYSNFAPTEMKPRGLDTGLEVWRMYRQFMIQRWEAIPFWTKLLEVQAWLLYAPATVYSILSGFSHLSLSFSLILFSPFLYWISKLIFTSTMFDFLLEAFCMALKVVTDFKEVRNKIFRANGATLVGLDKILITTSNVRWEGKKVRS